MIKLQHLTIIHFKGIKNFDFKPDGQNRIVAGQNGTGKTTVYDAFLWLLFGKDSTGRKDFGVRPLGLENEPIKGIVTSVTGVLNIDGTTKTFKKDLQEKVVKGQIRGYETLCWIDDVPKKVGEYADSITELIDEHNFKMLTDLHFFNDKLHWTDRREILLKLAGDIEPGEQFTELLNKLSGRTMDEYKKVIAAEKKGYVKERDEINPRIDEQQKVFKTYAEEDVDGGLIQQRMMLLGDIETLDEKRKELLSSESKRTTQLDAINEMKAKLSERTASLRTDTAGHKPLYKEKAKIEGGVEEKHHAIKKCENMILSLQSDISTRQTMLESHQADLQRIRDEYLTLHAADFSESTCSACGQTLPEGKIGLLKDANDLKCKHLASKGNQKKAERKNLQAQIEKLQEKLTVAEDDLGKAKLQLSESQTYANERLKQISDQLDNRAVIKPDDDAVCKQLVAEIAAAEKTVGKSASEQLTDIENKRREKTNLVAKIDKSMAGVDTKEKAAKRIEELNLREKELGVKIAELDGELSQIGDYQAYQSNQVEMAVDGQFQHVAFKLFNTMLNESIEPCCDAMLDGTLYPDCSYGEKALMGADIINCLSSHYGISVPVFIDNSESLTVDLELKCQKIYLKAVDSVDELTILEGNEEIKKDELF